jgi:D-serine deaminase-like pyridoxal phosphate-dependent protein
VTKTSTRNDLMAICRDLETPALVVDLDVFDDQMTRMVDLCRDNDVEFLPHSKTHRMVELANRQLALGANGLTVATIREAEGFVDGGARRIVSAYPLVGESKIRRYYELAQRADVTVSTDSLSAAREISRYFAERHSSIDLLLLIDSGMGRVGVPPAAAPALAKDIAELDGVTLRGVLTHEGLAYRSRTPEELTERTRSYAGMMVATADEIRAAGVPVDTVSLGASASAWIAPTFPGVTQVRPGAVAFNDLSQVALGLATIETCGARVISTVVSNPVPGQGCIDAGSKTLSNDAAPGYGAEVFPGHGVIVELPGWQIVHLSEEHGWLRWVGEGEPPALTIGERVQVIPNHICTVFSSSGSAVGVADGKIVGAWPTITRGLSTDN